MAYLYTRLVRYILLKFFCTDSSLKETQATLESMSPYYKMLSPKNKNEFAHRVLYFNQTTEFNSPDNFEILHEMRTMISAAFVQMSFGLKTKSLLHYNRIHLVPKKYSYKHIDEFFYGDVNPHTHK